MKAAGGSISSYFVVKEGPKTQIWSQVKTELMVSKAPAAHHAQTVVSTQGLKHVLYFASLILFLLSTFDAGSPAREDASRLRLGTMLTWDHGGSS